MREIRILAPGGGSRPQDLRVREDGTTISGVRGFSLHAHVNDERSHMGGPPVTLTLYHFTGGPFQGEEPTCGPATVLVEVPVWVQYVRTEPPPEPAGVESGGNGVWEEFVAKVHEVAQTNPSLRDFADSLASHPLSAK